MLKFAAQSIVSKYIKNKIIHQKELTENDLAPILREIRIALLNSDVNIDVIKSFFEEIKHDLLVSKEYSRSDNLDVIVLSTIKKKLIKILGEKTLELNYSSNRLNKVLVVGLNGSGKTTSTAKLSLYVRNKFKANVKVVSLDIYRPGAYEQIQQLCAPVNIPTFKVESSDFKTSIKSHIISSEKEGIDCIFFDNYGLLSDNDQLLQEVSNIKKFINPTEVIFVIDAMSGQDILDTVRIFHERLNITGLLVSKSDSNAPMGGVFSISYLLKIPIKYMGKGESINDLSIFHPDRIASLILGEGDILSLAEKMEQSVDVDSSKRFITKFMTGNFDLDDLITQIKSIRKMGSLKNILKMLPGNLSAKAHVVDNLEQHLDVWEILLSSMTKKERKNPKLFKKQPSRKIRVVKGSGRNPEELNRLLKKWEESKKKMSGLTSSFKSGKNPFKF